MAKLAKDLSVGNLHPRENIFGSGTISAANGEVIINCDGCSSVAIDLRGTFSLTMEVSVTIDGTNWQPMPIMQLNGASAIQVMAATGTGQGTWIGAIPAPAKQVRARCTAFTSGSVLCTISASTAPLDPSFQRLITSAITTTIGTAGGATTLSITAPGAGLRQYLTYLSINRFATAALTAAATPVAVTTTNLPGSLAFTFAADALTIGQIDRWREDFAYPIMASAVNTAVTIVCPATTGVIWRITAGHYVAP